MTLLTAYTITDEQIREMQRDAGDNRRLRQDCLDATVNLSIGYCEPWERRIYECTRRDARARCAEILNRRAQALVATDQAAKEAH